MSESQATSDPRKATDVLIVENGGRPATQVWGSRGMVCSMHPQATDAAIDVLNSGGNAIDAAIALGATLGVTSSNWAGIGGESVLLIYWAETKEFFYVDGYSTCPTALNADTLKKNFKLNPLNQPEAFREEPPNIRHNGVITSMTPGTLASWIQASRRFGKLPFSKLLACGIRIAEEGFPINGYLAQSLRDFKSRLTRFESTRKIFCKPNGDVLDEGDTLIQKDLADTYRRLADSGGEDFYSGEIARHIANYSQTHGGLITLDDLASYRAVWRPVQRGSYRDLEVVVSGPPTSGTYLLQALNILEGYPLRELGYHTADSIHLMIEATKLALRDRRASAGDPDFIEINSAKLLDKNYAADLRAKIRRRQISRLEPALSNENSTTHFVVMDTNGNIVSGTQTIGAAFGCCEVIEGTGIVMNDRSWWMTLNEGPNMVAPGRRSNIGHAPTILMSRGKPYLALGSPGGSGIIQFVLQTIVNIVDYGLNIQDAIEAPRFRVEDLEDRIRIENRVAPEVRETLAAWGHKVVDFPAWTDRVGGVEGLSIDPLNGNILGGYDPRRNSMAVGVGSAVKQMGN